MKVLFIDPESKLGGAQYSMVDIIKNMPTNKVIYSCAIKGKGELSAIQEVERDFTTQVISIVTLTDLISYLESKEDMAEHLANIKQYRVDYGI